MIPLPELGLVSCSRPLKHTWFHAKRQELEVYSSESKLKECEIHVWEAMNPSGNSFFQDQLPTKSSSKEPSCPVWMCMHIWPAPFSLRPYQLCRPFAEAARLLTAIGGSTRRHQEQYEAADQVYSIRPVSPSDIITTYVSRNIVSLEQGPWVILDR